MAPELATNSPAGDPPAEAETPLEDDILGTLGLSDTSDAASKIAAKAAEGPEAEGSKPAATQAPEGGTAPPSGDSPPSQESEAPDKPAAAEPAKAPAPQAKPAPAASDPPPAASPAPAVDEAALREASLTAQVQALRTELDALRANPQTAQPAPAGQPAPAAESGQPAPVAPRYNLTLPEQVQQALLSEDPQHNVAAISAIMNDLGTIVHANVITQVRQEITAAIDGLVQRATAAEQGGQRQTAEAEARDNYYKAFPAHNNPLVLPLIQAENQKLAAEFPGLPWNEHFINALGARVNAAIAATAGLSNPAPDGQEQPAPAPTGSAPPAKPAGMLPSGNRGAGAVNASGDISDEIEGVLSPF